MKKEERTKDYEAPRVRVVEAKVEKGFAASEQDLTPASWDW